MAGGLSRARPSLTFTRDRVRVRVRGPGLRSQLMRSCVAAAECPWGSFGDLVVWQTLSQSAPKQSFAFRLPTDHVMDVSSFAQISHNRRAAPLHRHRRRPFSELQDIPASELQGARSKERGAVAITVMAAVTTTANNRNNNDNHFARTGSMQIYDTKDERTTGRQDEGEPKDADTRICECADIRLFGCGKLPGEKNK